MQMRYWLPLAPFLLVLSGCAQAPAPIRLLQAFHTKIDFYGQVVDQDGAAIEGARVIYSADGDLRALGGNSPDFEMMTEKNGMFSIHTRGAGMYVSVKKEGYRDVRIKTSRPIKPGDRVGSGERFQYFAMEGRAEFNHQPAADRPVQFTLRKVGKLYKLLATDKRLSPKSNGEPLRVSLNGDEGSGHEIQIICKSDFSRTPVQPGVPHRYAWSFEIVVENGGIQEMKDEEGFEAPESGYVPKLTMASMDISAANWLNDFWQKNYYVRFDDGVCARFECQGGTEHGNGKDKPFVYLDGLLNPDSKSRSLETAPIR